jgi:hypothetical protein
MQNTTKQTTTTTTDTTTANAPFATPDRVKWELEHEIEVVKRRYETALAKFLADAQKDPSHAVGWYAKGAVEAQVEHEVWLRIERELAEHDPHTVLAKNVDECRSRVQSFFGTSSTCAFTNAVARARAGAYSRLAEHLTVMKRHLER